MTFPYLAQRPPQPSDGSSRRAVDLAGWVVRLIAFALLGFVLIVLIAVVAAFIFAPSNNGRGGGTLDDFGDMAMRTVGPVSALILFLVLALSLLTGLRRRRASAVLAYVQQAMSLNLPLPAMLRAAENSESLGTSRALRRLRLELEGGQSVHDAVAQALPAVPSRTIGLVGAAERSGRLPQALARLTRENVARFASGRAGTDLYLRWYPATLALVITMVVALVMTFVIPKFEDIFRDFKLALPPLTLWLMDVSRVFAVPLGVVVAIASLMYIARMLVAIFAPASVSRGPLPEIVGPIAWYVPGLAGMTRWRGLADACNVIADTLEAGHPLDRALVEASRTGTNAVLARRLADWGDFARAGMPAAEGARRAEMPALLSGLLRTVAGPEIVDVFRFLGRYYDSRFARSAVVLHAILVPAMTIVMGVVVGVVALGLFMPLIYLTRHMADMTWSFR